MSIKESENRSQKHSITITDRSYIALVGIEEVISFDESAIVMQSSMGQLTLDGDNLNIVKLNLDDGDIAVEGKLNALYYMEQKKSGGGLLSRLFG